jgi:hypothetical protein
MNEITDTLNSRMEETGFTLEQDEVLFALLAAACSGCCEIKDGGNGGCPPIKEQ